MTRVQLNVSSSDSSSVERYVPALTGLRAIAAYLVFLHHYNPAIPTTFAHRLFHQGYVGVSIFFVLSGFLIYHRYADTYLKQENWSWRRYLRNRFARIFPLYALLFMLAAVTSAVIEQPMSLSLFVLNFTLLKGFFEDIKFSGIAQSWSLTVEISFYLLAPLLFTGLQRWGAFWVVSVLTGTGLLLWLSIGQMQWHGLFSSLPFVLFYTFFGRSFEFIVGMWVARRWHLNQLRSYPPAMLSGIVLISACVIWQANVVVFTNNSAELVCSEFITYNCLLPLGIGLVLVGLLHKNSLLRYVLSHPVCQALGRSSYAFYLIHIGFVASGLRQAGIRNYGLLFGSLLLVAHLLYLFVEKPLHRRLSGRRSLR